MNKISKTISAILIMATLFTSTAFAGTTVPVRKTFEEMGFTVSWNQEDLSVTLSKDDFSLTEKVGENISLNYDTTTTTEEFVNTVLAQWKREALSSKATVTQLGEGFFIAETEKLGEVMFTVDDATHFHHEMNRMLYRFTDLEEGSFVKVYFSEAMTASIPPQTYATEVVFLNEEVKLAMTGMILEKNEDSVLVNTDTHGEVIFMVDENTNIHHEMNKMLYRLPDLEEGMMVTVNHSEAMTLSLPPQTYATEIIINASAEPVAETITTEGKILATGEDYFTLETENGTYRFNCSEETNIHHIMNRRLYRFPDLEEGMMVQVIHHDAATFSIPPQMAALEVIIK